MENHQVKMIYLIILFIYMLVLFIASSLPDTSGSAHILSGLSSLSQNFLHVPAFGFLTLLWMETLKKHRIQYRQAVIISSGISMLYGSSLELYQSTIPGRFPSMIDIMLNFAGIFLLVVIYTILQRRDTSKIFKC
jgi:VanZ family protein